MCSESHAGVRFASGQFHPPIKELKNSPIHHRPCLPQRRGAVGSGNRYRTMLPNVLIAGVIIFAPFTSPIPSFCELLRDHLPFRRSFFNQIRRKSDVFFYLPVFVLYLYLFIPPMQWPPPSHVHPTISRNPSQLSGPQIQVAVWVRGVDNIESPR